MESFAELTSDTELRERLEALYDGDIDRLEWYVGIFAEDYPDYLMMGELLTTMVANDAFTQALTNPLLSRNVFNEETFSPAGMKIIERDALAAADPGQELAVRRGRRRQLPVLRPWRPGVSGLVRRRVRASG